MGYTKRAGATTRPALTLGILVNIEASICITFYKRLTGKNSPGTCA